MQLYNTLRQLLDVPATFQRPTLVYQQIISALAEALTASADSTSALMGQTNFANTIAGWIDVWGDLAGILRRSSEADSIFKARLPAMLLANRDSPVAIEEWLQAVEQVQGFVIENLALWGYQVILPVTLPQLQVTQIIKNLAYVRPAGMPFSASQRTGGTYLNTVNYRGPLDGQLTFLLAQPGQHPIEVTSVVTSQVAAGWQGARVTGSYMVSGHSASLNTVNYRAGSRTIVPQLRQIVIGYLSSGTKQPWKFGGRVTGAYFAQNQVVSSLGITAGTPNQQSLLPDLLFTDPTLNPSLA